MKSFKQRDSMFRITFVIACVLLTAPANAQDILSTGTHLIRVAVATDPSQFATRAHNTSEQRPMSAINFSTLASIADVTTTYIGMKQGVGREGNPYVTAIAGQSPTAIALTAIPHILAVRYLHHRISRKAPWLADAIAANLANEQMHLASNWTRRIVRDSQRLSGFNAYQQSMVRSGLEESTRRHLLGIN